MVSLQICKIATNYNKNVWTSDESSFIRIGIRHNEVSNGKTTKSLRSGVWVEGFLFWAEVSFQDTGVLPFGLSPSKSEGEGQCHRLRNQPPDQRLVLAD